MNTLCDILCEKGFPPPNRIERCSVYFFMVGFSLLQEQTSVKIMCSISFRMMSMLIEERYNYCMLEHFLESMLDFSPSNHESKILNEDVARV
jgi:hypothetical protein